MLKELYKYLKRMCKMIKCGRIPIYAERIKHIFKVCYETLRGNNWVEWSQYQISRILMTSSEWESFIQPLYSIVLYCWHSLRVVDLLLFIFSSFFNDLSDSVLPFLVLHHLPARPCHQAGGKIRILIWERLPNLKQF